MKQMAQLLLVLVLAASALFGCGEKTKAPGKVDLAALEKAFTTADTASKEVMLKAVAEFKASDYPGALAGLGRLNRSDTISADQKRAVNTAMRQIAALLPPPNSPLAPMAPPRQ
jgi:hypothetical protein